MRPEVITRTRGVFIHLFIGMKKGVIFFLEMNSIVEAPPVPDEECGSSPILGAGMLDVPPEIRGQFHNRFRDARTALYSELGYRCQGFCECKKSLVSAQVSPLLWEPEFGIIPLLLLICL